MASPTNLVRLLAVSAGLQGFVNSVPVTQRRPLGEGVKALQTSFESLESNVANFDGKIKNNGLSTYLNALQRATKKSGSNYNEFEKQILTDEDRAEVLNIVRHSSYEIFKSEMQALSPVLTCENINSKAALKITMEIETDRGTIPHRTKTFICAAGDNAFVDLDEMSQHSSIKLTVSSNGQVLSQKHLSSCSSIHVNNQGHLTSHSNNELSLVLEDVAKALEISNTVPSLKTAMKRTEDIIQSCLHPELKEQVKSAFEKPLKRAQDELAHIARQQKMDADADEVLERLVQLRRNRDL